MLFVWGSKKAMKIKNDLKNGNRNTNIDSDLADSVVFKEAETTMKELYAEASDPDLNKPVIQQSRENPHIACVRGTNDTTDTITDVKKFLNMNDDNWNSHIKQIKDYLQEHPEITHLIGHSLGGATAAEAIKDLPNVFMVGLDAARVLNSSEIRNTRNIQSDSQFDTTLDPYSIPEMNHTWKNFFTGKGAGLKVGHNAWKLKYKRGFIKKCANKVGAITGYKDGKIRFSQRFKYK